MKRLTLSLFLATSLLTLASPSQAKDLILVSESTNGQLKLYVDRDTLQTQGKFTQFYIESVKTNPDGSLAYHVRELLLADCATGIYQTRETHIFIDNEDGIQNQTIGYGDAGKVRNPPTDSIAYGAIEYVCK